MAFQSCNNFYSVLGSAATEAAGKELAQSCLLEERLSSKREAFYCTQYQHKPTPVSWRLQHRDYIKNHVNVDRLPHTFDHALNSNNAYGGVTESTYLVHLVRFNSLVEKNPNHTRDEILEAVRAVADNRADAIQRGLVDDVFSRWHKVRLEQRPVFVGLWDEINDLFPGSTAGNDWADSFRDRYGLIRHMPRSGPEAPAPSHHVVLLKYEVSEYLDKHQFFAIPTVLDGGEETCFHPSPKSRKTGAALNLSQCSDAGSYSPYSEIVHKRIQYKSEHVFRLGTITRLPEMDNASARRFHAEWYKKVS